MRQHSLMKRMMLLSIMLSPALTLYADKVWINNPSITEPSAFAPVLNENLYIEGTNFLDDHIHIIANTSDVVVTVSAAPAVVTGDNPNAALHIFAALSRTVTFSLRKDLMFRGSTNDLLITFSGRGNLVFEIEGDMHLTFTSLPTSGGAYFVVNMDNSSNAPLAEDVTFRRFPLNSFGNAERNKNVYVGIGPKSLMSYISSAGISAQTATIAFDPANRPTNRGRLVLFVENDSSVLIMGNQNNAAVGGGFGDINLTDIAFNIRAGDSAILQTERLAGATTDWSGLLVVNNNTMWNQLQSNPWCEVVTTNTQTGFILGQNGILNVLDDTYFDYVGTVTNYTIYPTVPFAILDALELEGHPVSTYVKDRNPSAFIVDGMSDPFATQQATIIVNDTSAIYFRSGVDNDGVSTFSVFDPLVGDGVISFTIDPTDSESRGNAAYGEIVFDVEGPLSVIGDVSRQTALNILSLYVIPTGGSVLIEATDTIFPLRTFQKDALGQYLQYNLACFMINNRMQMFDTNLQHTDLLHEVFENNFPQQSEASYIGGETWLLCQDRPRPNIVFYNSQLLLHTDAAFTGVDLLTPEREHPVAPPAQNISNFVFYYNGRCVDQGTGRNLILGTTIGGLASDLGTVINRDTHLNIYQEFPQTPGLPQRLDLLVSPNNNKILEQDPANQNDILNQFSVQSIFLGHASNISIGTNGALGTNPDTGASFVLTTTPTLFINGDFFSFNTQGGLTNQPQASMSTGEGGIFVDNQGVIQISSDKRAYTQTVVTKSRNGIIALPKRQVFFAPGIGVANWQLNLADPSQLQIVAAGTSLSDYTLDWKNITNDWCVSLTAANIPYDPANTPAVCQCPNVINQNLISIPQIRGTVDQFQIKNSRLGDQAAILIDGGLVREFVLLEGSDPGVAPVGTIVLQNDAHVGLGTASRNVDSDQAQLVLGINGISLLANGPAEVVLNEDTLINNVCHILTGTAFGLSGKDQLYISSVVPRELRIKNEAVLDLSMFNTADKELVIGGLVTLVFEPGARLVMGGGKFRIADDAKVVFEPFFDENLPVGTSLTATDNYRAKITGSGEFIMSENAEMFILRDAYVGVESAGFLAQQDTSSVIQTVTLMNCSYVTTQSWRLRDAASIHIGSDTDFGGSLQIGNTSDLSANGATIDFTLQLDGPGVVVDVNSQGLLGLGVGVVDKPESAPNTWIVDRTFNVTNIRLDLVAGTLRSNQIFLGNNNLASLIAIGRSNVFTLNVDGANVDILGGGNMVQVNDGPIAPTVLTIDGVVTTSLSAGILASQPILFERSKGATLFFNVPLTATQLFNVLKMPDYTSQFAHLATISQSTLGKPVAGYIDTDVIVRDVVDRIASEGGTAVTATNAVAVGTVGIGLEPGATAAAFYEVIYL